MAIIQVSIKGTRPMLMHGLRLLNRFDPLSKAFAEVKNNRKKTDADLLHMQRIDWEAAMYYDDTIGPYVPSDNLEAAIREGAKLTKGGKDVQRGVTVMEDRIKLQYKGPRDMEKLYNNGESEFIDARGVRNQQSRVIRCRPIFKEWALTFNVAFDETVVKNAAQLRGFIADAGRLCGLGDYRPKFGRFEITDFAEVSA